MLVYNDTVVNRFPVPYNSIYGNYRIINLFSVVMVVYYYVDRIRSLSLPPFFPYNIYDDQLIYM